MPILAQDLELVERAKGGDSAAFESIVRKYQDRLYNVLLRFVGSPATAQDLAQDTFLKAYQRLADFRGDSQVYTWLYAIARNLAISHVRSPSSRSGGPSLDQEGMEPEAPGGGDPVSRAMSRDRERLVQEALLALDEEARWVVVMRDIEGRDYDEIAGMAGVPVGTVKSRLHRARMQLRHLLEGRV